MKTLMLGLLLLSSPARAWWWSRAGDPLAQPRQLFEAGLYREVVSALEPAAMQKLRGRNLRQAYLYLGESHERLGLPDKALGVYQVAVKLYRKDLELLTKTARLLHAAGLDEQALPFYDQVLAIDPNNTLANLGLAEIDHALGFLDRSAERYEKALQEDLAGQAYIWRAYAEVLHELRDYVTAEAAVRQAITLSPDVDSLIDLALIQRAQGRGTEAIKTLSGLKPTPPLKRMLALWLMEEGQYDSAAPLAASLLQEDSKDPLARYISARLHLKAGRRQAAAKDLEEATAGLKTAPFVARISAEMLKSVKP
jgi:tetratricopeptide (TPR) repeat protein